MIQTRQPRKQRKFRYNAPLHVRQKWVRVHLSKDLRAKEKKRALGVRKGDTVKVLRGSFKGRSGKVSSVDLGTCRVLVEGLTQKKQSGKELLAPLEPSNLLLTERGERK